MGGVLRAAELRRGNSKDYSRSPAGDASIEDHRVDEAFLKSCWERSVARDRLEVKYDDIRQFAFPEKTGAPSCETVALVLEMLAKATGDEIFVEAQSAMVGYGLVSGGVKRAAEDLLKRRGSEWLLMAKMHAWVIRVGSRRQAAQRTAAQYGVSGASWPSVIDRLESAYGEWLSSLDEQTAVVWPDGNTGRILKVRFARPWLGADNQPIAELMGVKFEADGFGLCPDNREWRRLIREGHIALYGVLNKPREDSQDAR